MATYNKTKSGSYKLNQLQAEINADLSIVPSCTEITGDGEGLTLEFAATLSGGEETQLDTVISNHTPLADVVNAAVLPIDLGTKLAIHESSRPLIPGKKFQTYWTGSGDEMGTPIIGGGAVLTVETEVDEAITSVDVEFHPSFGDTYIHEGYVQWDNAGWGDCISVEVIAKATPLQQSTDLDYELDGYKIRYASGGAGTGTDGLNGTPVFVLSSDTTGWWDLIDGSPSFNATQTGKYDWYTVEVPVSRFINKVPVYNSSSSYVMLQSADTTLIPPGYVIRISAFNSSNTVWKAWMLMTLYRERTV